MENLMGVNERHHLGLFWSASLYAGMICVNEGTVPGSNMVAVSLGPRGRVDFIGPGHPRSTPHPATVTNEGLGWDSLLNM